MRSSYFHHVGIHVTDIERGRRFYDAVLGTLGMKRYMDIPGYEASAYGAHDSSFRIVAPAGPISVSSSHIAFAAESRAQVDAFFRTAIELGATPVSPHPVTYDDSYEGRTLVAYTASFKDYDGNHVEAVHVASP